MTALAIAHGRAGRLTEVVALQEQTLAIKRRVLPPDHPFLAVALQHMSDLHLQAGRKDEVEKLRAELAGLPAAEEPATPASSDTAPSAPAKKGPEAAETIAAMTELAAAYGADGSGRKAIKLGEEALALARRVLPAGAPQLTEAKKVLIPIYRSVDLEADAAKLEAEIHAISSPKAEQ